MATVAEAFDLFLRAIEPTADERAEATRRLNAVRDALKSHLGGVKTTFLAGSFSRQTAIRPLSGVDLVVVLDAGVHAALAPPAPAGEALAAVRRALAEAYPVAREASGPARSVHVAIDEAGIGFEVAPAFEADGGLYLVPGLDGASWIKTKPDVHWGATAQASKRARDKLIPLIRAAKHWNLRQGSPLRSFHLEVLSHTAFPTAPSSYPVGLRDLFRYLPRAVLPPARDPARVGPNLDAGMTDDERARMLAAVEGAARDAGRAVELESSDPEAAHAIWRGLLGDAYPEAGRSPG